MKDSYNVIIITLDALRPDYLGCYGSSLNTSPNIDKLAKKSVLFKNAYSPLYGTDQIHTTILTGLWPWSHGILHHGPWVKQGEVKKFLLKQDHFLPNILRNKGYKTLAVDFLGRWHKTGFDHYSGILESNTQKVINCIYRRVCNLFPYGFIKNFPGTISSYDSAEAIVSYAKKLIKEEPFFLFLHFWDTHTPYDPPLRYSRKFKDIRTENNKKIGDVLHRIKDPAFKEYMKRCTYGAKYTDEIVHRYLGAINYIDEQIGKLVSYFKSNDLFDNTLIIITSDHGEHLGEHDAYFDHHTLFQELIKVALIIKFPNGEHENKQVEELVRHVDLAPTIIDVLGLKTNFKFDGETLMPLVNGLNHNISRKTFFGRMGKGSGQEERIGVIDGRWKYSIGLSPSKTCLRCGIVHHQNEELYDLKKDPKEKRNIVNENPAVSEELKSEVWKILKARKSENKREIVYQESDEKEKIPKKIRDLKSLGKI